MADVINSAQAAPGRPSRPHQPFIRPARPAVAFWLVAFAFAAAMIGTTLPTPLYPGYEARFGFGPLTVTFVFATYAVGVLIALIGFGRASDTVGRRPVLMIALLISALASAIFLIAGGLHTGGFPLLFVGRLLSGLTAGLFTGSATATLADLARPTQQLRASLVAAVANVGGLGLGPLIAGLLARYAPLPLQTSYAVHLGLLILAAICIVMVPETVKVQRPRRVRVQRLFVPPEARAVLVQAGTAGFAGFAVLGLFTAITPAVLGLLGHHNPALTGTIVFIVFAASACGQLSSAPLSTRISLLGGISALIVGIVVVGLSLSQSSLGLLIVGGVIAGAGQGLSFRAALGAISAASPADKRGAVASTFFTICYVGISLPVVGIGIGTKFYGLVHTGEVFAGIIALLSVIALVTLARTVRKPAAV